MRNPEAPHSLLKDEMTNVWAIAWPLILTNILNVSVGLVDFKMVGILGVESIAAVGMSRQVIMFIMVLMIAISGGSSVLVAHAYGANDPELVSRVAARSAVYMLATALLIVAPIGYFFSRPILEMLGGSALVVGLGDSYLKILFTGSVFTMFNIGVSGILLGVGKTRVSLVMLLMVNVLNIGLNYVFIFGVGPIPAFGVAGAAIGTVAARGLGCIAGVWILTTPRFPIHMRFKDGWHIDLGLIGRILYLGGPRSLQGIVRNFSRLMTIRIITLLPDATRSVSAYSVGMQVRMISSFIGLAFMSAAMARVGQNLGAKDTDRATKSGWIAAGFAAAIMSAFTVVFLAVPDLIMAFFTDDREVISLGRTFFVIIAVTEPIMAFAFALSGALRGGGDSLSPFLYGSISDLVVVILVGYLLAVPAGMGFAGIATGIALSALVRAFPITLRYRRGKWKAAQF
ncbi:MAG TPA: MATE family efflux transporter [Spirochaetia bacterium]|nr:MATE family efflux transporter [Spirochaetia bacterium]